MDRNTHYIANNELLQMVALRKESVDRNFHVRNPASALPRSLSARRAWIEITDRRHWQVGQKSLSARRAWIEIIIYQNKKKRNPGRSPQGERG